jgi:short subunit dehydrogenase-like uncharacterized protein
MTSDAWLLYGANGYTGELIAEAAVAKGVRPLLAGRREEAIRPIASRLGLAYQIFDLDDTAALTEALESVSAVLLCAGPFSKTSKPVVDACIKTGTHYLDITGEISVFEACHARTAEAARAGCVIMPGVGFDVVPSDCLAASLAEALPGAQELELAFYGVGTPSKGTAKTMLEGIPQGGAVRRDGSIVEVPLAWKEADIPFADKTRRAVTIPWGDVSTAYYSTGIPNIRVYMASPRNMRVGMKLARPFKGLIGRPRVQKFLAKRIEQSVKGPDAGLRQAGYSQLWGRVRGSAGQIEATLRTPEGYQLTVQTALESTLRVVRGEVEAGAKTPSMAFGAAYITEFDDCVLDIGA